MFRLVLRNATIAAGVLLGSQVAMAENRVALVIGQSAYRAVTPLPNPANDAKAMAQLLGDAGFEVQSGADLTQTELRAKVGAFAATIAAKGLIRWRWCSMPVTACRSMARIIWCRWISIRSARPTFRCRRSVSTTSSTR